MQLEQDNLKHKNEELVQAFREKSRKQLQTQELYDKLKQREMLGQVQNAAYDAVDHSIQASVIANRVTDVVSNQNQRPPQPPLFSTRVSPHRSMNIHQSIGRSSTGDWAGFRGSQERATRRYHKQYPVTLD